MRSSFHHLTDKEAVDMLRLLAKLIVVAVFGACAPSILPLYEQTFQETLATAPPVPKNWSPDASLQLSNALLQNTVRSMIETSGVLTKASTVDGPLGITAKIKPNLRLQDLKIGSSEACAHCATVKATVEGNVRWSMGSQGTRLPVAGHVDFVLKVQPKEGKKRWSVTLKPHQINSAGLQLATLATSTRGWLQKAFTKRIHADLLNLVQPMNVISVDKDVLPLLAIRPKMTEQGLTLQMLSAVGHASDLQQASVGTRTGWEMRIAETTLLELARKKSFQKGPLQHDIVIEPNQLHFTRDGFSLGLRLWRLKGRGWWRDFTVHGKIEIAKKRIKLHPETVEETGKSPGASWVDPLATLAQGLILKSIENTLETSLPRSKSFKGDEGRTEAEVTSVTGAGQTLIVRGRLQWKK